MNIPRKSLLDRQGTLGWVLSLPALLAILGIVLIPMFQSLGQSFFQRDLARPANNGFIGLLNYVNLLQDGRYLNSLFATFRFSLLSVVIELVLGVSIALVLNKNFVGRGFVRGLMILPWAMPSIVNAAMWKWIYNADYGALNALFSQLGIIDQYQIWLSDPVWATVLVILANVWKETPFVVIMVLAALQTIPEDLYEAANVDGSSPWQSFFNITVPLILPVLMIVSMLQFIWGFQTYELISIVTGGGPFSTTEMVTLRVYATTFRSLRFGYGSAMAYLTCLVVMIPVILYVRSAYKKIEEF
ncbi:MAG TPA: sugar ABC transporter permease [Anaerolineaceae bacterium]|nr:sugar ABC transporter permease [Anaerolineaceae bacterium]